MVNNFQSRKCSLRAVLPGNVSVDRIQRAVLRCDTLWTHCLLFLKGFLLHKYEQDPEREQPFPQVNSVFVLNAFKVVAGRQVNGGNVVAQQQRQEFQEFFDQQYAPTMPPEEGFTATDNLTQILNYMAQEVVVCYETNMKQHWLKHLKLFVNDLL